MLKTNFGTSQRAKERKYTHEKHMMKELKRIFRAVLRLEEKVLNRRSTIADNVHGIKREEVYHILDVAVERGLMERTKRVWYSITERGREYYRMVTADGEAIRLLELWAVMFGKTL